MTSPGPRGRMAPCAEERITVRHGELLVHCSPEQLQGVATTLRHERRAVAAVVAGDIRDALACAVAALGGSTLAKGLAVLRSRGVRMPRALARALLQLDAAAALLQHPGAAADQARRLEEWLRINGAKEEEKKVMKEETGAMKDLLFEKDPRSSTSMRWTATC